MATHRSVWIAGHTCRTLGRKGVISSAFDLLRLVYSSMAKRPKQTHGLPDLTRLGFYTNLIQHDVPKQEGCTEYLAPWYDNTDKRNCSQDGYLMAKKISSSSRPLPPKALGDTLEVMMDGEVWKLDSFPRDMKDVERQAQLDEKFETFPTRMERECLISKKPPISLSWKSFNKELIEQTDLYLILKTGFLFIRYCDTKEAKELHQLPYMNNFEQPYLFVILVCNGGVNSLGKKLLNVAEQVAEHLGVERIVLSALPGVVGYYYNVHNYWFIDRGGEPVNVTEWENDHGKLPFETTNGPFPKKKKAQLPFPKKKKEQLPFETTDSNGPFSETKPAQLPVETTDGMPETEPTAAKQRVGGFWRMLKRSFYMLGET